jgi:hypothetical protein
MMLFAGCRPDAPTPIPPLPQVAVPTESISIDYPDADIRQLLETLAPYFHLKLDLPRDLHGRTSLKLREVSWRQIFQVVLSPIGYDFYEENGTVFVRTNEEIASLPPVSTTVLLHHLPPPDAAAYLNRRFRGGATFTPTESGVAFVVSRKLRPAVEAAIHRADSPETLLKRFPRIPHLPKELPKLVPAPREPWQTSADRNDAVTTQIFIFDHIDAELAAPYLEKAAASKYTRVVFDIRINALIVTATEARMPHLEAIVTYLDDVRWYAIEPAPAQQ